MEIIRRSPASLVVKIIIAELLLEIVYLVLSLGLSIFSEQLEPNYQALRLILGVVFIGLAIIILVIIIANWANQGYILEKNDLAVKNGIFSTSLQTYPYANMQSVTVKQGLLGKLLNYGHIIIYVPTLGKDIGFYEISNPYKFA